MKARYSKRLLAVIGVALLLSGCNIGATSDTRPATLMPQEPLGFSDVTLPTLGYSTPQPGMEGDARPIPTAAAPAGAYLYNTLNQIDTNRMMNTIATLQGFHTRHVNSIQTSDTVGVGAAYRWLMGEFEKIQEESRGNFQAFPHSFRAFYNDVQSTQHNVVGVINGTEPNTPVIIIGAHYDSRTDDLTDATGFAPGADDNGSGVAAVIEMARILSQTRPRTSLIFVLFAAEEVNRQGSIAFVRDYVLEYNIPVKVMINIDTIGSNNDSRTGRVNDTQIRVFSAGPDDNSPSRQFARMIHFISTNHSTDLEVTMEGAIDREGRFGDHMSFSERGIPAVRFIEALEDTIYREGRDTIEHIEPDYLRRATRTILTVVMALSDGLKAPPAPVVREMPDGMRRLIWQPVEGATGYVVALRRPGDRTFEQVFNAPGLETAYECDCFVSSRFVAIAVAAINDNGIMGPLSPEVRVP